MNLIIGLDLKENGISIFRSTTTYWFPHISIKIEFKGVDW
jgi:hypothetical protein